MTLGRFSGEVQASDVKKTLKSHADEEALLPADADDDNIRAAIAEFRTDLWSRFKDTVTKVVAAAQKRKASILSLSQVIMLMTLSERASFAYDFVSDGKVGYALVTGGNPWWGSFVLLFMAIPYLVLLVVFHAVVQKKLGALFGYRKNCITLVWLLFGIPFLLTMDVFLNVRFLCSQPHDVHVGPVYFSGVELFHYMALRKIVEFTEGFGQLFIQGYIWIRLCNPGGMLPAVSGIQVDPFMLLMSIAFSVKGVVEAVTFVQKLAKKQMRGDYVAFLRKMALLGEGLVPSVIYYQIEKQRAVVVTYDLAGISDNELLQMGRAIRESTTLEELTFKSLEFLQKYKNESVNVINFCIDMYYSSHLKELKFGTEATDVPAWLRDAILQNAELCLSLPFVMIGGDQHRCPEAAELHIESAPPLVRHALSGDDRAFRRIAGGAGQAEAPAEDVKAAIRVAAALGHVEVLRAALLLPLGLQALRAPGVAKFALEQSARRGQALCVSLLLSARADPDSTYSVLYAATDDKANTLELLLAARGEVDKATDDGTTPLFMAAQADNVECLQLLLAAQGDVDKADRDGVTPLLVAAQSNNVECLKLLLAARGEVDKATNDGATPLFTAAQEDNVECLQLLLAARGEVDKAKNTGATPLFVAAQDDSVECLQLLLAARGEVDKAKDTGATPLNIAAQMDNVECLKLLLAARSDVDKAKNDGSTPLFTAAEKDNVESLKLLLASRGDVNKPKNDGATPLFIAAYKDNAECLQLLLAARGDVDKAKGNGETPISIATQRGCAQALRLLREAPMS